MYGKRDGRLQGLAIVSKDPRNLIKATKGFKTGTIHDISMLGRQDMWKPQAWGSAYMLSEKNVLVRLSACDWYLL